MTATVDPCTDDLVARAAALGPELAAHAARHDADGTFVEEGLLAVREAGLLAMAVPIELGGDGATIGEIAAVQRELAHHCGSTALGTAMHQHVTAFIAWRYRRNMPGAEAMLRRIAAEEIVLASSTAHRPYGAVDGARQVIASIAMPIISGVYLGVAEAAFAAAVDSVSKAMANDPIVQRQIGLMAHRLQIAAWALDGTLAVTGDDPDPSLDRFAAAMLARREVALAGIEVCDIAMQVAGGSGSSKASVVERCSRDIRAANSHPFSPELTPVHTGRIALGLPVDEIS